MTPRVSVITPTFEHAPFIEACVRSVIDQTEPDWEMVVVDDGSTDGTPDIVARFDDPRIRLVRRSHGGLADLGATYNLALRETTAPFVAVLEGDDSWPAHKLARQLPSFDDPDVVLSYGRAELIDREGRAFARYARRPRGSAGLNDPIGAILPALARGNFIVAPSVMIRRSALERIGGFLQPPSIPFVDHPTWMRLALEGRFAFCESVVGRWRRHARQYSTSAVIEPPLTAIQYIETITTLAIERGLVTVPIPVRADAATTRARSLIGVARLALLARDGPGARRALLSVMDASPSLPRAAIVLVGVLASLAGRDIEWLFRASGRLSWPSSLYSVER